MALTEKVSLEIVKLARADSTMKIPVYAPSNQGARLYTRLAKIMPLPALYRGSKITTYLRMLYTSARYFVDVYGDK